MLLTDSLSLMRKTNDLGCWLVCVISDCFCKLTIFAKLWMFKPSIRLAYNMRTPRASPKNAAIHAAKVLYKLFGPSEDPIDLSR